MDMAFLEIPVSVITQGGQNANSVRARIKVLHTLNAAMWFTSAEQMRSDPKFDCS